MSRDERPWNWRKALKRPTKPDTYNVRIITRGRDGMEVVIDLTEVPKQSWIQHFGTEALDRILSDMDEPEAKLTPCVAHDVYGCPKCDLETESSSHG